MIQRLFGGCLCLAIALTMHVAAAADPAEIGADIRLPTSPDQWLNFPPLSLERLGGKGVVLYFFEEDCPTCAKKWPSLLEQAQEHALDPVVVIGVNSGTPPAELSAYLREHQITWPVIVDIDRSFERQVLGSTISLKNIYGIRIRKADGKWEANIRRQMPAAIEAAAKGGRWRVMPTTVPPELRPAWGLVELGNFSAALPMISRYERRGSDEVKQTAAALRDAVGVTLAEEQDAIGKLLSEGEQWQAYQAIGSLLDAYQGYEVDPQLEEQLKELKSSDAVRQEQTAAQKLQQAYRVGSAGSPAAIKRATTMLTKIVTEYPDTEAASKAEGLLQQVAESQAAAAAHAPPR